MKDFIELLIDFDKEYRKEILNKLNNNEKLNPKEIEYLYLLKDTYNGYKRRRGK